MSETLIICRHISLFFIYINIYIFVNPLNFFVLFVQIYPSVEFIGV